MKRQFYIFFIVIIFGAEYSAAQVSSTYTPKIIPSSPQSEIFENYLNHAISEYNGLPKIEIPLYEIKTKDISIPITLSYHASGIKFMQYDGDIGAGWSIGASGYRLTRSVRGADDFGPSSVPTQYFNRVSTQSDMFALGSDARKIDGFLYGLSFDPDRGADGTIPAGVMAASPGGTQMSGDGQYDKFSYMLPTSSGSFIIKDRATMSVAQMDDKQDMINLQENECVITDVNGIEYHLGGIDGNVELCEKERITQHTTAWVLKEIKTPSHGSINFRYKRIVTLNNRSSRSMVGATITDAPFYTFNSFELNSFYILPDPESWTLGHVYNHSEPSYETMLFLDEIETDHLHIKFDRGSLVDMNHILKKIRITDKLTQKVVNEIIFNNEISPYSVNTFAAFRSTPSHVLLQSVINGDKIFRMSYVDPPSNYKYAYPDQWNNYNFNPEYAKVDKKLFLHKEFLNEKYLLSSIFADYTQTMIDYRTSTLSTSDMFGYVADRSVDEGNVMSFTLRNIQFPTGGNTEYVFEPHQTETGKGGGLRIKKIISQSEQDRSPVISEFHYGIGSPNFKLNYRSFLSESYSLNHSYLDHNHPTASLPRIWYGRISRSRTYLMNPMGDFNLNEYNIFYRNVDVLQYDLGGNKYNGKKSIEYNLPSFPSINYYEGMWMAGVPHPISEDYENKKGIARTYEGLKPTIKSTSYFDDGNNLIKKEVYEYIRVGSATYEGLKVNQRFSTSGGYVPSVPLYNNTDADGNDYTYISSYFDRMVYEIETGTDVLSKRSDTLYTNAGKKINVESYVYNNKFQLKKINRFNSNGTVNVQSLYYPSDFAVGSNIYQQMVYKNIIAPVIETVDSIQGIKEIKKLKTEFGVFNDMILPKYVKTSYGASETTELAFNLYDAKGNLLQLTRGNGANTFYLWSYKYQYLVAEIRNATLAQIETALYKYGVTLFGHSASLAPGFDGNLLRQDLPYAFITTYTYEPSIGITSITDSKGIKTSYFYDQFNRLKYIEDHNGTLIKEYDYHYRTNY
ncbi:hypothetical protein [Sphingobacterium siyangense]|uniref:hypothetical protein n=1 Tax=Sphingobacterium siyangense TaxID=459529 RepID=UPI002FDE0EA8